MDLQQLRYFREVAEQKHVTRAAQKLFITQSAVSRSIAQLEDELGVALFHRQGRSLLLSHAGQIFLEHVVRAQSALDSGINLVRETAGLETGTVALGFLPSLGVELIPRLVREYRQTHTDGHFALIQDVDNSLKEFLLNGSIDLCLSAYRGFDHPDVHWKHLWDQELFLQLPGTHPLAGRRSIRLAELSKESFLVMQPTDSLRDIFDSTCAQAGFVPNITFESASIATLSGLVAAGLGVAMLPSSKVRPEGCVEVRLVQSRPVRPIGIASIPKRQLPACSRAFCDFVERSLAAKS